jgi:pimeloyl-ACP methyl ester carboxylesterase
MRIVRITLSLIGILLLSSVGFVYLVPEQATSIVLDMKRADAGLTRKQISLSNGEKYVYLEGGTGTPLLLLHGFGANKDNFTGVAKYLTASYRVIAPDHIGFGESIRPANADYSPPKQVERLHEFIQLLGLDQIHLGGSSMGGQIAMTYAAIYPQAVKSMWLLDPAGIWSAPEGELSKIIRTTGENPLLARNEKEFSDVIDFVMNQPPYIPRPILDVMAQDRITNIALERNIFEQILADPTEARISGLKIPTLIVWGQKDRAISVKTVPILQKLLPNSQAIIMQDIGHLPMLEAPEQTAADYLKFRADL